MKLVARDIQILYAVGVLAPVPAEEIGRLLFPTSSEAEEERRSTVRARLLKLAEEGLLTVLRPPNVAEANRYALTPKGRELVVVESGADTRDLRVMTTLGRTNLVHHDMVVSLRVSFVLACQDHTTAALNAFHAERALRRTAPEQPPRIVPDAIAAFEDRADGRTIAWAIEADTGTERHAVWNAKLRAYLALAGARPLHGYHRWGVAVVVPTEKRAGVILRATESTACTRFTVVAVTSDVSEKTVLGPIWRLASGSRTSLIAPLARRQS